MPTRLRRLLAVLAGIAATIGSAMAGYVIYEGLLVDDICAYHDQTVETAWLFDLFFPMSGWNGYHPEPGSFFYFISLVIGVGASLLVDRALKP